MGAAGAAGVSPGAGLIAAGTVLSVVSGVGLVALGVGAGVAAGALIVQGIRGFFGM